MYKWALVALTLTPARVLTLALTLTRWALVGRTEYDAIVVIDVDVDLFLYTAGKPPAAGTLQASLDTLQLLSAYSSWSVS